MKKIGGKIIFCGVVLSIGPLFGFTLRGQEELDFGASFLFGLILIVVGIIINSISVNKE